MSKEIVFHVMDRYSSIFLLPFRIIGWIGRANRVRGGILSNVQGCGICSFKKKKRDKWGGGFGWYDDTEGKKVISLCRTTCYNSPCVVIAVCQLLQRKEEEEKNGSAEGAIHPSIHPSLCWLTEWLCVCTCLCVCVCVCMHVLWGDLTSLRSKSSAPITR